MLVDSLLALLGKKWYMLAGRHKTQHSYTGFDPSEMKQAVVGRVINLYGLGQEVFLLNSPFYWTFFVSD